MTTGSTGLRGPLALAAILTFTLISNSLQGPMPVAAEDISPPNPPVSADSDSQPDSARIVSVRANSPILRIYLATLDRLPDQTGLQYWSDLEASGQRLDAIASYFMGSEEFRLKYGSPNDGEFVGLVYENVLNRPPDQGGLTYWTEILDQGYSRALVVNEFAQSTEFVNETALVLAEGPEPPAVLLIGDSIFHGIRMLGLPVADASMSWETKEGRQPASLPTLLAQARSNGTLDHVDSIVIHLGTNGWRTEYESMFVDQLSALAPTPVLLVNVAADRPWANAANRSLLAVAGQLDHVQTIDWHGAVAEHSEWLRADGVHPTAAGLEHLADLIGSSVIAN